MTLYAEPYQNHTDHVDVIYVGGFKAVCNV